MGALRRLHRDGVLSNTAYLVANSASLAATGFLFWIVAARRFPASDVGIATALISATLMITLLSSGGLGFAALRDLPRAPDAAARSRVANACLALSVGFGVAGAVLFLALAAFGAPDLAAVLRSPWAKATFVLWVSFQTGSAVLDNVLTAAGRSDVAFWRNSTANLLKIGLAFALPASLGAYALFAASTLPMSLLLVVTVSLVLPFALHGHTVGLRPDGATVRSLLGFGVVAHAAQLLYMAPQHLLPLFVLHALGPEDTAYLYTAWKLAALVWIVTTGATGPLLAAGSADTASYEGVLKRVLAVCLAATSALAAGLALFGGAALSLFGEAYAAEGSALLARLAVSSVPLGLFALYMTTLRVLGRHVELVGASAAFALCAFASYALAPASRGLVAYGEAWLIVTAGFGALAAVRMIGPLRATAAAPRTAHRAPAGSQEVGES